MNVSGRWLVCVAFLLTSCLGREGPQSEEDEELSSGSCGVERWSVKTGSDSAVGQVNMTAQDTTIVALRGMAVPSGLGQNSARFTYAGSPEIRNYRLATSRWSSSRWRPTATTTSCCRTPRATR